MTKKNNKLLNEMSMLERFYYWLEKVSQRASKTQNKAPCTEVKE